MSQRPGLSGGAGGSPGSSEPRTPVPRRPGERCPAPQPVRPSRWSLPDPAAADEDGVVGVGADLAPGTLVDAYARGIFPWPHDGMEMPWFSPDPRGLVLPGDQHVSQSLRRTLVQAGWTTTVDAAFDAVTAACATDRGDDGTWITTQMRRAYRELHDLGWAHSLEVWDRHDALIGGIYGVQIGGTFTGESMFHRRTDASKVALVDLLDRLVEAGGRQLDVQLVTGHLASLGATEHPRAAFLQGLSAAGRDDVRLLRHALPVARLGVLREHPDRIGATE